MWLKKFFSFGKFFLVFSVGGGSPKSRGVDIIVFKTQHNPRIHSKQGDLNRVTPFSVGRKLFLSLG